MTRDFKGVWIPKDIWNATDLSLIEKCFLVEIDSLDNEDGCYASNKHFAAHFGITKGRCTQIIKDLESKKLITITHEREGKMISKRIIKVVNKLNTLVNKLNRGSEKIKQGYLENAQENNTIDNNTSYTNTACVFQFLENNYSSVYETFLMQYKKDIKDWERFKLDFNDTVLQEGLTYDAKIFGRLRKYARVWIDNRNGNFRVIKNETIIAGPQMKRIG